MKVDYFSDIHIDIWVYHKRAGFKKNLGHIDELKAELIKWIKDRKSDADIVVFAGDAGNGYKYYQLVTAALKECYTHVIATPGNHCFYKSGGYLADHLTKYDIATDHWIACPLWTNFRRKEGLIAQAKHGDLAENGISDWLWIPELAVPTAGVWYNRWKITLQESENYWKRLLDEKNLFAVVTHFPPSLGSLDVKFKGDNMNGYFVNDEDERVKQIGAKFWFHGHTHSFFDYQLGETRIISKPIGYPGENYANLQDVSFGTINV